MGIVVHFKDLKSKSRENQTTSTIMPFAAARRFQTIMASQREDAGSSMSVASGDQGERKSAAVSFGFTKTVSRLKSDSLIKKDDRDYLTGIDRNELQR